MKMEYVERKASIEDKVLFSTGVIGDHAKQGERLSLFTVPRGQRMPQIPFDAHKCETCQQPAGRVLDESATNIVQAGQMGSSLGDARFDRIRAVLSGGDPVSLEADVTLRIAGRAVLKTTLAALVKGWVPLEDELPMMESANGRLKPASPMKVPYVLVARTDTVECCIELLREAKVAGEPMLVRIEIEAKTIRDLNEPYSSLGKLVNI